MNTNHTILQIDDPVQKSQIAKAILYQLPDWFGIPESTNEYIDGCADKPLWAAIVEGSPVGFIALKETSPVTAEIYVMGVLHHLHHSGIGRSLFSAFERYAKEQGHQFIQVKTVRKGSWESYDKTNEFYVAMGFSEFECFPEYWDEKNPCQIYVKAVPRDK